MSEHLVQQCNLYLISPPKIKVSVFAGQLESALAVGNVGAFQLRLKDCTDAEIIAASNVLLPICKQYDVAFILNDRVDLVKQLQADGVHLGQDDMPVAEAREILGEDSVIGVSCHDSMHLAMEAGDAGADYVAFGAFYPTKSKSAEKLAMYGTPNADILQRWQEDTILPCVAIGGMTPLNCVDLVAAGADFIAAITAIWEHAQGPAVAVSEFNSAIAKGLALRDQTTH